jgi:hypothetical protein
MTRKLWGCNVSSNRLNRFSQSSTESLKVSFSIWNLSRSIANEKENNCNDEMKEKNELL